MKVQFEQTFIDEVNSNLGIIHKVANIYFLNSMEREDVVQEMMLQLWKSYSGFRGDAKFSTWMYRICLNTATTYFKKAKTNQYVDARYEQEPFIGEYPSNPESDITLLHRAIHKLSKINKAIILLYLEELNYGEIAQITGLSKSNISVRLVRIKKELKKVLNKLKKIEEDGKY